MRINSGIYKGRLLSVPKGDAVRPTGDKMRQALFNILQSYGMPADAHVLDVFCGTGALGLEALSRGAASADFVELNPPSLRALGANIAKLGAEAQAHVRRGDALRFVEALPAAAYDLAFADPPYAHDAAVKVAERWLSVPFARVLGVEHSSRVTLPAGGDTRTYGDTAVTIYRVEE